MQKTMLIGESGSGKSTLIKALSGAKFVAARAMAVEYFGRFVNTPGEFLENRRFYPALITAATECEILVFLQDPTRTSSLYPPLFCTLFNRLVVGVVSKIDAEQADVKRAERFLRNAGAKRIILLSAKTGQGVADLQALLF